MPFLTITEEWYSQPQELTSVLSDAGLAFAANFIETFAPDLVSTQLPTPGGVVVSAESGRGVQLSSTTDAGIIYGSNTVIPASSAAFTVIVTGTWAAEARLSDLFFYGDESGGNYPQHSILLNADSTNFNAASSGTLSAFTYDGGFQTTIKSTANVIDGKAHTIGWRNGNNSALSLWMDGRDVSSTKTGGTSALSSTYPVYVNQTNVTANGRGVTSPTSGVFVFPRILSDAEMEWYTANPWRLFAPLEREVFYSAAAGSITADASITQAGNTSDSAATIALAVDASITQAANTSDSTSTLSIVADSNQTQAGNTLAGIAALSVAADASITQADDTPTADAALTLTADASVTHASNTMTSDAALVVVVDAAITQDNNTLTSAASLTAETITANALITQDNNSAAADGTLVIAADASITQEGNTTSADSTLAVTAILSTTQSGDTLTSAAALASDTITADASITQDSQTATADGTTTIASDANITQDDNTSAAIGVLTIVADCFVTQTGNNIIAAATIEGSTLVPFADRMRLIEYDTRVRTVEYDTRVRTVEYDTRIRRI